MFSALGICPLQRRGTPLWARGVIECQVSGPVPLSRSDPGTGTLSMTREGPDLVQSQPEQRVPCIVYFPSLSIFPPAFNPEPAREH